MNEPLPWSPAAKEALLQQLAQRPYRATPWLRGGHFQTIVPALLRTAPRPALRVERLATPDADAVWLHHLAGDADQPLVLVLHGLEGSADSGYIRRMLTLLRRRGWGACVMEFRGCSAAPNRARRLYHSGETSDLDLVAETLRARAAGRPLLAVGYSLGGNVLLKWLGERGAGAALTAAIAISAPYDLSAGAHQLDAALGGRYARSFLRSLIPKALAKERQYPGCFDIQRVRRCRGIVDFDDCATAPLHGFAGAEDYYTRSSCAQFLPGIRVPTLLLSAANDPLIPAATFPRAAAEQSPWLVPQFTAQGGHVGFPAGALPWRERNWPETRVLRALEWFTGR